MPLTPTSLCSVPPLASLDGQRLQAHGAPQRAPRTAAGQQLGPNAHAPKSGGYSASVGGLAGPTRRREAAIADLVSDLRAAAGLLRDHSARTSWHGWPARRAADRLGILLRPAAGIAGGAARQRSRGAARARSGRAAPQSGRRRPTANRAALGLTRLTEPLGGRGRVASR